LSVQSQARPRRHEALLLLIFILTLPLSNPWIRGDGVGYYAYLRAPLIEHSLDFTHDYLSANDSFREGRVDEDGHIVSLYRTKTGHLDNHFTVGPAVLWSPFVLLAHFGVLIARHLGSNVAADGFSSPYRYAMALGTAFYGFLGLWLSYRLARKYVAPRWSFLATVAIWWASSVPVYMYFNPSWSHIHSAFVCALFLWYWDTTRGDQRWLRWVILGIIAGLMVDVYYANLMLLMVPLWEAISQYLQMSKPAPAPGLRFGQLFGRHLLFVFVISVVLIPTFLTRWIVYGGPFESGYVHLRQFLWATPAFIPVLFSSEHGLLAWTPLLGFAIVGLILFARRFPAVGAPFLAGFVAFYLFIGVYPDWAGISSYGNRFFVSLTPLFVIGLAYLLERVASLFAQPRTALAVCSTVLACFVLWNLGLIYQWGIHLVPARGPVSFRQVTYNQFFVVPGRVTSSLRAYFFRRSDLMRQIEKTDVEQLNRGAHP
jgi:hypothetical protein